MWRFKLYKVGGARICNRTNGTVQTLEFAVFSYGHSLSAFALRLNSLGYFFFLLLPFGIVQSSTWLYQHTIDVFSPFSSSTTLFFEMQTASDKRKQRMNERTKEEGKKIYMWPYRMHAHDDNK